MLSKFDKQIFEFIKSASWRSEITVCRKFGYAERMSGVFRPREEYDWHEGRHTPTEYALYKLVQLNYIEWFQPKTHEEDFPLRYRVK